MRGPDEGFSHLHLPPLRPPGFSPGPIRAAAQLRDPRLEQGEVLLPDGVIRRKLCQPRHDLVSLPQGIARPCTVAGLPVDGGQLGIAHCKIALPSGVGGIGIREALFNTKAVRTGFQRGGKIPLRLLHAANLVI